MSLLPFLRVIKKDQEEQFLPLDSIRRISARELKTSHFENLLSSYKQLKDWYSQFDDYSQSISGIDLCDNILATACSNGDVKLVNIRNDPLHFADQVERFKGMKLLSTIKFLDRNTLLTSSTITPGFSKYDLNDPKLHEKPTKQWRSVSDVQDLALLGSQSVFLGGRDGSITIQDLRLTTTKSWNPKLGSVLSLATSSCEKVLICGTEQGVIMLYDIRSPNRLLKSFKVSDLIDSFESRSRFTMREDVEDFGLNTGIRKPESETTIIESFEQSHKERILNQHFGSKRITSTSVSSIVINPNSHHLVAFQLLNSCVGYLDLITGRLCKIMRSESKISVNDSNTRAFRKKPCFITSFGVNTLCMPMNREVVLLDWKNDHEDLFYESWEENKVRKLNSRQDSKMITNRIALSSPATCLIPHPSSGKLLAGTANNTIIVIGKKYED